jgi:hypothetical protein
LIDEQKKRYCFSPNKTNKVINSKILEIRMKKLLVLIFLALILASVFAAQTTDMVKQLPYEYCLKRDANQQEQCFKHAYPYKLNDCDLLKPEYENYDSLLLGCYQKLSRSYPEVCGTMPFNDANKQLCYIHSRVCEKILNSDSKDDCYHSKYLCESITNETKKDTCVSALNQKNFNQTIGGIFSLIGLLIYLLFPIAIILIVIKTILDVLKIRKEKYARTYQPRPTNYFDDLFWKMIRTIFGRIILIGALAFIWLVVSLFFCFPPCYMTVQY